MLNRGYVVATAIAIVLSFSAAVADEAERIESCTAETNAVVQAFLDHALSDAGAELRLQAAAESGTLHFLETVWNAGCLLDPLYHDDAQIE